METRGLQISVTALLLLVACCAFNMWLFRLGFLWGFIGLNITKHAVIAYLCQIVGVNRRSETAPGGPSAASEPPPLLVEQRPPPTTASGAAET